MFLCLVLPGVAGAGATYAGLLWAYAARGDGYLQIGVTGLLFLGFVGACSWFAGHLTAAKSGEEGLRRRTIKGALWFFLAQIFLAPAIGWGTCLAFIAGSGW